MAVLVWSSVGFYVVLFSAAIDGIPKDLYEAALLDGAGGWATFRKVTLPLVRDTVQVAFVYLGIAALDALRGGAGHDGRPGGPDGATEVIGLSLYRTAFTVREVRLRLGHGRRVVLRHPDARVLALRVRPPRPVGAGMKRCPTRSFRCRTWPCSPGPW